MHMNDIFMETTKRFAISFMVLLLYSVAINE